MPTRCAWNYTYCLGLFQVEDAYFTVRRYESCVRVFGRTENDVLLGDAENPRRGGRAGGRFVHGVLSVGVKPWREAVMAL
jgi:hypothetical protein